MPARLTRRSFVGLAALAGLAPGARAAPASVRTVIGKSANELAVIAKDALADGYRFGSLSVYGPEPALLYTAVLARRPAPMTQRHWLALSAAELDKILSVQAKDGYGPALIAATGTAAKPVFALVCEPQDPPALLRTGLKSGKADDHATIEGMNRQAKREGRILRSVTVYGAGERRFAAIWGANPDKVVWNADGTADPIATYRAREWAHASAWCRPSVIAPGPDDRYLSVFVDDQVDHWATETDLSAAELQRRLADAEHKGLRPLAVQGVGRSAAAARFAAILVHDDAILPRAFAATGPVANAAIDDVMKGVMTRSRIRQASLAIVKGARLVYARGYTFAEDTWPITQPTTFFRLASVSKTITALAIYQLIAAGKLKLDDRMQDVLALKTPAGGPPKDARFGEITIDQLLAHKSGLSDHVLSASLEVRRAFASAHPGKAWHLPVSAEMIDAFVASRDLVSPPGKAYAYNNCAYYLLGRIVAKLHGAATPIAAFQKHLLDPLGIKRVRRARSLAADQPPDEARYVTTQNGGRDIPLRPSVMSDAEPLVPVGYGTGQLEISDGAGGLTAAMTDVARLIAMLIDIKDNAALSRDTLRQMLTNAAASHGHGLDRAKDLGGDRFYGQKGGALSTSWNVLQMNGEYGFALCWAGVTDPDTHWYPDFPALMSVARQVKWSDADLFDQFGMAAL
jgi:CubicO group peptidase (beta-lactamase class C family)